MTWCRGWGADNICIRSRRNIRKPSGPAPTAPLPAPPTMSTTTPAPQITLQTPLAAPNPRHPLIHRLHPTENQLSLQPHLHAHNHIDHANTNTNYTITSPSGISSPDFTSKLV